MPRLLSIFTLLCLLLPCRAQLMDSLGDVFKHQYSIDARLESRNSFISHELISVSGVRLGVAFKRKLRLGGGISWLKSEVKNIYHPVNELGLPDTVVKYLKFVYLCYYADFVFHKTKRWQLSVPIQLGTGYSWQQARSDYHFGNRDRKYFLFLYEPGITVQFKVLKWAGLGADVAYRFALNKSKKTGLNLNSPTFSFKLLFWFDQLYYDLFPDTWITKKYGPSYW